MDDLIKILKEQINLLVEVNEDLKEVDIREVRCNIDTIDDLVRTIHFIENH